MVDDLQLTVVYDNEPGEAGLAAEWGFACLVEGPERPVLFDAGGSGTALLGNMARLAMPVSETQRNESTHHGRDGVAHID